MIIVRCAGYDDRVEVLQLAKKYGLGGSPSYESMQTNFTRMVNDAERLLLIAITDSPNNPEIVGYAYAQDYGQHFRCDFTTGRLHDVFVLPEYRKQGVGRKLMDGVIAWARERPVPIILDWQASPAAISFYESLGFSPDYESDQKEYPAFHLDTRTLRG